jgi:hypothetical protein
VRVTKTTGGTTTAITGSTLYAGISTVRSVHATLPPFLVSCAVGDYLQLNAFVDAGTVATEVGSDGTTLLVEWVGAS